MKIRGIITFILTITVFVCCLPLDVFAIKADGALDEKEWKKAEKIEIISSSDTSNCNVSYAMMYIFCDESASRIYIGFKVQTTDKIDENSAFGAAVSADSGEFIYITTGEVSDYDTDKYDVEAKACRHFDYNFVVEIALGIKYGLSSVNTLRVRMVDADGNPSNIYTVKVPYGDISNSELITQPLYNNSGAAEGTSERTTKAKTTKPKTTKVKTTKPKKTQVAETLKNTDLSILYQDMQTTTSDPYGEETTAITVREFKIQKGFTYAAVCALILTALGICIVINYSQDKEKSKKSETQKKETKD